MPLLTSVEAGDTVLTEVIVALRTIIRSVVIGALVGAVGIPTASALGTTIEVNGGNFDKACGSCANFKGTRSSIVATAQNNAMVPSGFWAIEYVEVHNSDFSKYIETGYGFTNNNGLADCGNQGSQHNLSRWNAGVGNHCEWYGLNDNQYERFTSERRADGYCSPNCQDPNDWWSPFINGVAENTGVDLHTDAMDTVSAEGDIEGPTTFNSDNTNTYIFGNFKDNGGSGDVPWGATNAAGGGGYFTILAGVTFNTCYNGGSGFHTYYDITADASPFTIKYDRATC